MGNLAYAYEIYDVLLARYESFEKKSQFYAHEATVNPPTISLDGEIQPWPKAENADKWRRNYIQDRIEKEDDSDLYSNTSKKTRIRWNLPETPRKLG